MTPTKIIGISGKAQAGKGSIVQLSQILLQKGDEEKEVRQVSFATAVKEMAREWGWDGKKDSKGRKLLQDIGMEKRMQDADYWVKVAIRKIRALPEDTLIVFLPDTRFKNEAKMIKEMGGEIWRVERCDSIGMPYDNLLTPEQRTHPSEIDLDGWPFEYTILTKSMTGLFEGVKGGLRRLGLI